MRVKWFGTASVMFKHEGIPILFDPFFPMVKGGQAPFRDEYYEVDDILITHGHFDHLQDVPSILARGNATVYCSEVAANSLIREGVEPGRIKVISPGDHLEIGPFQIRVLKGKHVKFNLWLMCQTVFSVRTIKNFSSFVKLLGLMRKLPEGQSLTYEIKAGDKTILHMGSLNMDETEEYPERVDIMTIPFQGRSDLDTYSVPFIHMIKPQTVYFHHFDDTFPPLTRCQDVYGFGQQMKKKFPGIVAVIPSPGEEVEL